MKDFHLAYKMVEQLSEEQIRIYKESFDVFDKDGDGTITSKEFGSVMRSLGQNPSQAQLQVMIEEFDKNNNGKIDFLEFCEIMVKKAGDYTMSLKDVENAFKVFDKDGSGFIEIDELRDLMMNLGEKLTEEEIQAMMQFADIDKDGKIDYHEFVIMMMQ